MENNLEKSQTKIIASTNVFQIEFVEKLGKEDYPIKMKLLDILLEFLWKNYVKKTGL